MRWAQTNWLLLGALSAAPVAHAAEPNTTAARASTEAETFTLPVELAYDFTNIFGLSNFIGRFHWLHRLELSASYDVTDNETVSVAVAGNGEAFSRTNGSTDRFFLEDLNIGASSTRLPELRPISGLALSFVPMLSLDVPSSSVSRKVGRHYGSWLGRMKAKASYKGASLSLKPAVRYTFYRTSDVRFTEKPADDLTQQGALRAPLVARLSTGIGYSIGDVSAGSSYSVIKTRTYENNAGQRFWRDYQRFSLGVDYAFDAMAKLSLSYIYGHVFGPGVDPLDRLGRTRLPFFTRFADYNNQSALYLSLSGVFGGTQGSQELP